MPEIDLTGVEPFRLRGPQARSRLLAFTVETARLDLLGDIDPYFGISVQQVIAKLAEITAPEIRIRINSYGGDVYEGVAIHNVLAAHKSRKVVEIIGCAASAASWVAMVADEILIWENATMMIHQSWQGIMGNADALEGAAEQLRRIDAQMVASYSRRTGLSEGEIRTMMSTDCWMTAEEAVAKGFADRILRVGETIPSPEGAGQSDNLEIVASLRGLADAMMPKGGSRG
ncbi:MAG: Clp protease ClpP [Pseudomonadota bacterium]|nr:Clp protease ClpP [Pseudomonadota bacterium]